jgi:hypothetical protein
MLGECFVAKSAPPSLEEVNQVDSLREAIAFR